MTTEKPPIYYSEPYQIKGKQGWNVDKFQHGKKQVINIWSEKLAWGFLKTITVTIINKNK